MIVRIVAVRFELFRPANVRSMIPRIALSESCCSSSIHSVSVMPASPFALFVLWFVWKRKILHLFFHFNIKKQKNNPFPQNEFIFPLFFLDKANLFYYNRHIYDERVSEEKETAMKKPLKILLIAAIVFAVAVFLYLLYLFFFVVLPMVPTFLEALLKSI